MSISHEETFAAGGGECVCVGGGGLVGGRGGVGVGGGKPKIICEKKWQKNEPNI